MGLPIRLRGLGRVFRYNSSLSKHRCGVFAVTANPKPPPRLPGCLTLRPCLLLC